MKNKGKIEDNVLESSSEESQSEDDEDGCKLTEEVEKEFYATLSKIKSKDPKIYQKDVEFFKDIPVPENKKKKSSKSNPITLRDYERKLVIEKGGDISDEEPLLEKPYGKEEPTYVQEQESLRKSLKSITNADSDDEDGEEKWGGLFKQRAKNKNDQKQEEESYRQWLKGQKTVAEDEEVEKNMKSLQECWSNPGLNEEDKFLRDYVLNKKYLENDEEDQKYASSEDSDEKSEIESNSFSHRFEEADQEFIKRYPRVMENSLRRKNDHRKLKREEVKERKRKEKQKKRAEVKEKQKQKRKEIEEKLEELKKITGNDRLAFDDILNKDFDMEEHEKAMERLFNDDFYSQEDPNFVPINLGQCPEEEEWNEEWNEDPTEQTADDFEDVNCEDPNFIMDCDYDPSQEKPKESTSRSRRRKDKHRRTTLSEAVKKEKPVFDPATHQTFQEYVDQYYGIDCEDFIGDLPCRFKYRNTVANSYGLTIEEILAADEKELEHWCSIKRIHQLRPEFKEKGDLKVYQKKAADEQLKRKILPSLYKNENAEDDANKSENDVNNEQTLQSKKKKAKPKKEKVNEPKLIDADSGKVSKDLNTDSKRENEVNNEQSLQSKKKKAKLKTEKVNKPKLNNADSSKISTELNTDSKNLKRKRDQKVEVLISKRKKINDKLGNRQKDKRKVSTLRNPPKQTEESSLSKMSDARLLAYGIKPKKFRNKLKYNKVGVKK